jgi:hypothetical protein
MDVPPRGVFRREFGHRKMALDVEITLSNELGDGIIPTCKRYVVPSLL